MLLHVCIVDWLKNTLGTSHADYEVPSLHLFPDGEVNVLYRAVTLP